VIAAAIQPSAGLENVECLVLDAERLEFDFLLAVYIVLGAAVSTIVMMALINLLSPGACRR
jgi:hypothetical protein